MFGSGHLLLCMATVEVIECTRCVDKPDYVISHANSFLSVPLLSGEKTFEEIDDLVADGLITLYMEANNVEEYLQSARRKKSLTAVVSTPSTVNMLEHNVKNSSSSGNGLASGPPLYPPPIPPRGPRHSLLLQARTEPTSLSPPPPAASGTAELEKGQLQAGNDPVVSVHVCSVSLPLSIFLPFTCFSFFFLSLSFSLPPSFYFSLPLSLPPSLNPSLHSSLSSFLPPSLPV